MRGLMRVPIMFHFILILILFLAIAPALSQDTGPPGEDPDFFSMFLSIPYLAGGIVLVTQIVRKAVNINGQWAQYLSWLIAVLLSAVGYVLQIGIFIGVTWYVGLVYALAAGLIANGLFDWDFIRVILKLIGLLPGEKKT